MRNVPCDAFGSTESICAAALRRFVQQTGLGVINTFMGKGVIDADDEHALFTAGLRSQDVIVGANRGRVTSLRELRERAKGAAVLVLEVRRGNTILLVPLR